MPYAKSWKTGTLVSFVKAVLFFPRYLRGLLRGRSIAPRFGATLSSAAESNPLRDWFLSDAPKKQTWKWLHYFDIYHRHCARFVGKEVHILEIGVLQGGSLDMWKAYFGPRCRVYGVDIDPQCKRFEDERTTIFIGDQADPRFWENFRKAVPHLDIVIDDGGHRPRQQIATFEGTMPLLRPGGLYICEDTHNSPNGFTTYLQGVAQNLNLFHRRPGDELVADVASFQDAVASVHLYPFLAVVELRDRPLEPFACPKKGVAA